MPIFMCPEEPMEEKSPRGTLLVVGVLFVTILALWLLVYNIMLRNG